MPPFRTTRRVEFCDTDMAGIAHFANFFRWMEAGEVEFLRARGLSVTMPWQGDKLGFPRVSATCDFVHPARFQDLLEIAVAVDRLGEKSVTYAFEFTAGGRLLARGKVTSVCCRIVGEHQFESVAIPIEVRELIQGEVP